MKTIELELKPLQDFVDAQTMNDSYASLALSSILMGIATGRVEATLNESLRNICAKVAPYAQQLTEEITLTVRDCISVVSQIQEMLTQQAELDVWNSVICNELDRKADRFGFGGVPSSLLTPLANWTLSTKATVLSFDVIALPVILACKKIKTTVVTQSPRIAGLWDLIASMSGLPICSKVVDDLSCLENYFSEQTEPSTAFLLPPWMMRMDGGREDFACSLLKLALKKVFARVITLLPTGYSFLLRPDVVQFRRIAVESQRLSALVELPDNSLYFTGFGSFVFLFDGIERKTDHVTMIDCKSEDFFARPLRRRMRVITQKGEELLAAVGSHGHIAARHRDVSFEEIIRENFVLLPSRFLLDEEQAAQVQRVRSLSGKLNEMVDVIRPIPIKTDDSGDAYREVFASSISEYGQVTVPDSLTLVDERKQTAAFRRTVLQPGDVVYCIKGSVGKCGIVPHDAPKNLVLGQTCVCMRLKKGVDESVSVALVQYLRSGTFKQYLIAEVPSLSAPNGVPFMSVSMVESFPVPRWSQEQLLKESATFRQKEELLSEQQKIINTLKEMDLVSIPSDWE